MGHRAGAPLGIMAEKRRIFGGAVIFYAAKYSKLAAVSS
jgi:hypothetical protein